MRSSTVCSMVFAPGFLVRQVSAKPRTPERGRGTGAKAAQRAGIRSGPAKRPAEPTLCGGRAAVLGLPFLVLSDLALLAGSGLCLTVIRERQVLLNESDGDAFLWPLPDDAASLPCRHEAAAAGPRIRCRRLEIPAAEFRGRG